MTKQRKNATTLTLLLLLPPPLLAQHSAEIAAVDEYRPAPGQFVNTMPAYEEGDDAQCMAEKCTEALAHGAGGLVTLGAWGGYITFHFDHPVVNLPGQADLYIRGNAVTGSSEAGIVCVSQDLNGNGLPDDPWYELSGSADTDSTHVTYDYELTYQPTAELQDIPWSDNQGNEGWVLRNAFHTQPYYPAWISDPLTFSGTRLPNNAHDTSGNGSYWQLDAFRQGYVDNMPNADTLANSFDIGWAVEPLTRMPIHLTTIDFVRIYTALNQSAGWLGETSTEVSGATDLHPDAVAGIHSIHNDNTERQVHDLLGRPVRNNYLINHQIFIKK